MPTALITGVNGFTGRYLARALEERGYDVVGMARFPEPGERRAVIHCDISDPAQVAKAVSSVRPNVVVHLAAISFVAHRAATEIYETNILGTRNLLDALAQTRSKQLRCVLVASSANVYGNSVQDPIVETTPLSPDNDYAVSKLATEYVARLWVDELPIVVVRPFNYTGVGQSTKFLVPKIVEHFRQREPVIELGNLDVARDFSDVRSTIAAYERLLVRAPVGEVFNVCSGRLTSLRDIVSTLQRLSGHSIEVVSDPALRRRNEVKRLRGSNEKLLEAVGDIEPIPFERTLEWMLMRNENFT